MNSDLKQISDMQLKMDKKLSNIQKTLDDHTKTLNSHTKKIGMIWEHTAHLTEEVADIRGTLRTHTATLKTHTDSLDRIEVTSRKNSNNINSLNKRMHPVENQLGIMPPPEFNII